MFEMHAHGLDVLAGVDVSSPTPMHVQAGNVPIYPINMMAGDAPPADLGEPVAMLQMGDLVEAVGPSVKNPNGAPFTPVQVRGRDGVFWVRSTSVAENAPLRVVPSASGGKPQRQVKTEAPFAWWKVAALAALGLGAVGVVAASSSTSEAR